MQLGTHTNSLVNHLYSRMTNGAPEPVVGMGATILHWTDRDAGTVFRVFKVGKSTVVEVREDKATRTDALGMSDAQDYSYKTNINGSRSYFRQSKTGAWTGVWQNENGRWVKAGGSLILGRRDKHFDFSF